MIPPDYEDRYLECRLSGHAWRRPPGGLVPFNAPWGYPIYRACVQCGCYRGKSYDRMGQLVWSRMGYPEGYLLSGGRWQGDRPSRTQWIRWAIEVEGVEWVTGEGEGEE